MQQVLYPKGSFFLFSPVSSPVNNPFTYHCQVFIYLTSSSRTTLFIFFSSKKWFKKCQEVVNITTSQFLDIKKKSWWNTINVSFYDKINQKFEILVKFWPNKCSLAVIQKVSSLTNQKPVSLDRFIPQLIWLAHSNQEPRLTRKWP